MLRKNIVNRFIGFVLVMTLVFGMMPPIKINAAAPNITTEAAYDIEMYEATVSAYIKTNGGNLFKEHGFYYGTTTSCNTKVVVDDNGGSGTSLDTPDRYTYTFDNLKMGTKYYYKAYVLTTSGSYYYGGVGNFTTETLEYDIEVDTIDTDGEQTMNTLEMLAELYVDVNYGKASSVRVGFEYGVKGGTQKKTTATMGHYDGDEFGWTLTGLTPGTAYTYRGYAIDPITGEYIYGNRVTITTLDEADFLPEVYTDSATDITLTSAVINGELEYTADLTTEYGFILGSGVTEQVKIGSSSKTKSFEYDWEYLQPNTKYTYKTYAKNKYGTVYGDVKTFYTKSDTTKPVIELLKSSLGNEFEQGSTVTFSAEASDNVALNEFILYVDNVEVDYSDYWTDYEELEYTTSKLSVGSHTIKAYAVDDAGNEATKSIVVKVLAPAEPSITNISPSKNTVPVGTKFSFNITANNSVSGVQLYVKENGNTYDLGRTTIVDSQTTTAKKFIIEYAFNSTGLFDGNSYATNTRRVYAYPIDSNGNLIDDNAVSRYCDITVTPATYTLGSFTVYDTEIQLGNNAIISWSSSSAQTNDSVYYNVYLGTKTRTILLTPNKTTSRSVTVDSSIIKELGTGTYAVMVIATAANHSQKQADANIIITASTIKNDTTKPKINLITSSADPIVFGSSVTFSTAASDETALDRVEMFVDGTLVKKVSADKYANISYTTDSLSTGNHTVLVKAYDDAGNYNSWSQIFAVKTISAGIVYDVDLSDYDFNAGSYVTFTVKTSKDTTKIRLVDGSYTFSVQSNGYKDSGNYRIWTFDQYVGTVGTNRRLKVESYSGGWTGNYYTTDPFTVRKNIVDVGDFEILSPGSGDKHQVNTALTVTWSTPDIKPDWYVVNVSGVPSGSDLISINGNSAVISGSAFNEYGTYSISVTAQKSGYNQSEVYANVTVGCLHEDRTMVGVKYGSEVYYNDTKHIVISTPQYSCNICGGSFTSNEEAITEYIEHTHDVELDNNGWLCDCGYVNSGSYSSWRGYLQSNSKEKAYSRVMSSGELTNWDGVSRVYPDDTITVVGTKYDAFLIKYSLASGGTKTRFVDRTLVDRTEYSGRAIVYVSIDGLDLRCVQEGNGVLYASAYDLAKVLNGSCSFVANDKLNCRIRVYDSVSALNYFWAVDLRNYNARANWQNLDAYTDESLTTLAKSAFAGAYVYGEDINISIKGVLDLLNYEKVGTNAYAKKNIDYELIKTAQSIRDTSGQFNRVCNMLTGEFSTYLYSIAKFDAEGLINKIADNVAFSSTDTIEAVKQSLLTNRSDEEAIEAFEVVKMFFGIAEKTSNGMEWFVTASCADLEKELEEFDDMMEPINGWFDKINLSFSLIDFTKCTIDHLYTAGLLAQNFDSNMQYLNILIANCESEYMKKVYTKVRDELELYYYNTVLGYFNSIGHNQAVHGALFDYYIDVVSAVADTSVTDVLEKKLGPTNGYLLAHAAVSAVADNVFKGEDLYSAASKLYIAADVLPEMIDEVNNAISNYRVNPSEVNRRNVVLTAKNLANYRIFALKECKKYEDSLVIANFFFNDEYKVNIKNIENESVLITELMNSLD